jgi:hypothetical protein
VLLATIVSLVCSLGCSVYSSSLLGRGASLTEGGDGSALTDTDAGAGASAMPEGGATSTAGSAQNGGAAGSTQGLAGDSFVAEAGDSTGGTAGDAAGTGGTGGMPANGGATAGGSAGALQELAIGKPVTASSQQPGNEPVNGNDNDTTTRWCASGGTFPQWWRVDLGASHQLSEVSIRFEHSDRTYSYVIETSPNDAVYTQQITASGTGVVQTVDLPVGVSARYVRITITGAVPTSVNGNGTWASFYELSLTGI